MGGFIPNLLYGYGDFLATWLHDTHSQKENNFTKSHLFSVPMKQSKSSPKCARKRLQSTSSPLKIHHKKLENKNLSLPLSLSVPTSNSQTSPPLQPQERKKERKSQTFPTKQNRPTSSFHFFYLSKVYFLS